MMGKSGLLAQIKNLPVSLGLGILRLVLLLPYAWIIRFGAFLGWLLWPLGKKRRRIAAINLQLCFPEWEEEKRQQVLRDHFRSLGIALCEMALGWWASRERLEKLVHISGMENVEQAKQQGKGIIVLAAHFTSTELGASMLSMYVPGYFMYRPHKNPVLDRVTYKGRMRWTEQSFTRDNIRGMIRALRNNKTIWYAQDQNTSRREGVFVDFFGHKACTNSATARLAKVTGAAVIPFRCTRREDGRGYDLVLEPALEDFPSGDLDADTQRINDVIERWVRECPAQYLWVHRRFRTRPNPDDPSPYK